MVRQKKVGSDIYTLPSRTRYKQIQDIKIALLCQPSGGLFVFGILLAVVNKLFPSTDGAGALTSASAFLESEQKEAEA